MEVLGLEKELNKPKYQINLLYMQSNYNQVLLKQTKFQMNTLNEKINIEHRLYSCSYVKMHSLTR